MSRDDDFFSEDDDSFGFSEENSSIDEATGEAKESELKFTFDHTINLQKEHIVEATRANTRNATSTACLALNKEGLQYLSDNNYFSYSFTRIENQINDSELPDAIKKDFLCLVSAISENSDEIFKNSIDAALERSFQSRNFIQPRISITLQKIKDGYSIKIEDNGIGFTKEHMTKFNNSADFGKFDSKKNGGSDLGGEGRGLSMLKARIMKEHSGTMSITNSESGGAQINISFPKLPTKVITIGLENVHQNIDRLHARVFRDSI